MEYLRQPDEIYAASFAAIEREADLGRFDGAERGVARRMIHACGMVDLAFDIRFGGSFATRGAMALANGADILCDCRMLQSGVMIGRTDGRNRAVCMLDWPEVAATAQRLGTTRSAAAIDCSEKAIDGAVVAIGNAPTALFRLLERVAATGLRPAAIVACPVGFVGAAESKAALVASDCGIPYVTVLGRRGGSAIAAAAVNALILGAGG